MNKKLLFCLLLFFVGQLFAQNGKIVGTVVDKETNEALPGCNIFIDGLMIGAASDVDGSYIILNVPPGNYNVVAKMVGYGEVVQEGVTVVTNLTTNIDFELTQEAIEVGEVTVLDYKNPPVQKDLTSKIQVRTSDEIERIPQVSVEDLLTQQAGIIKNVRTAPVSSLPVFGQFATIPTDGLHFRGGRENETLYMLDGVNLVDELWGGFLVDEIPEQVIASMETYTGTFDPKYGEAMSGVVNISPFSQIAVKPKFSFKGFTDNVFNNESYNTNSYEIFFASAFPSYDKLGIVIAHRSYSTDGNINGYIYPEYVNSEGQDKSGTPEVVPMQYVDTRFTIGKLIWQPITPLNITIGGFVSNSNRGVYNHYFKYNPYGTPRVELDNNLIYGKVNYVFNPRSFLTLIVENYERSFTSRVFDNPLLYDVVPQTGTAEFSISGEDWVYFDTFFNRKSVRLEYVWQINKIHNLALGGEYALLQTTLSRRNPDGFTSLENYDYKPVHISSYVNDKMEFDEMGMIINLGARFDYIDTKRKVLVNLSDLTNLDAPLVDAEPEYYITPRLGISFPVADKAAIRFGYGQYFQFPNYYKVFQGTYYVEATGEYRPNPQLENSPLASTEIKPEKTTNYEFGLQTMISPVLSADVTAFYRKVSNLIGVVTSETNDGKRFLEMNNIDYASVKGFEISLKKHFADNFSAFFNYTFSKTLVSSTTFFETATEESRTFPADWDQPHSFRGSLFYKHYTGFGFSVYGSYSSGFPYTRSAFNPNGERGPWIHQFDINLFKDFDLWGFQQQLFVQIINVTNDPNVWWVYSDSGIPGDDANPATSHDYTNNPSMYGPGRTVQFGIRIWN